MTIKVIWHYSIGGTSLPVGLSEVHYHLGSSTVEAAVAPARELVRRRLLWSASLVQTIAVRLSRVDDPRETKLIPSRHLTGIQNGGIPFGQTGPAKSDIPNTALLGRFSSNNQVGTNVYLGGVPDIFVQTDPPGPTMTVIPTARSKFNSWRNYLLAGDWGWRGRTINPTSAQITDWVTEGEGVGRLGAVTSTQVGQIGDLVQVKGIQGFCASPMVPRGQWRISDVIIDAEAGTFTHFLRNTESFSVASIKDPGVLELVEFQDHAYTSLEVLRQVTRKRGVGSIRRRGRLSRRCIC